MSVSCIRYLAREHRAWYRSILMLEALHCHEFEHDDSLSALADLHCELNDYDAQASNYSSIDDYLTVYEFIDI